MHLGEQQMLAAERKHGQQGRKKVTQVVKPQVIAQGSKISEEKPSGKRAEARCNESCLENAFKSNDNEQRIWGPLLEGGSVTYHLWQRVLEEPE